VCVCVRVRRCVCGIQCVRDVVCVCVRARACEQACRDVQPGYGGRVQGPAFKQSSGCRGWSRAVPIIKVAAGYQIHDEVHSVLLLKAVEQRHQVSVLQASHHAHLLAPRSQAGRARASARDDAHPAAGLAQGRAGTKRTSRTTDSYLKLLFSRLIVLSTTRCPASYALTGTPFLTVDASQQVAKVPVPAGCQELKPRTRPLAHAPVPLRFFARGG